MSDLTRDERHAKFNDKILVRAATLMRTADEYREQAAHSTDKAARKALLAKAVAREQEAARCRIAAYTI